MGNNATQKQLVPYLGQCLLASDRLQVGISDNRKPASFCRFLVASKQQIQTDEHVFITHSDYCIVYHTRISIGSQSSTTIHLQQFIPWTSNQSSSQPSTSLLRRSQSRCGKTRSFTAHSNSTLHLVTQFEAKKRLGGDRNGGWKWVSADWTVIRDMNQSF